MKTLIFLILIFLMPTYTFSQQLQVSIDGHRLIKKDGSVFFYMADTGWELFHRCSRKEAEMYLKDRKEKGFNVIQAVVLAELDGLNTPNSEGHTPLIDNNPLKPNEAYFKDVDWIVNKAQELGIYIGMLPTWGDKWNLEWGVGPVIFDTPEKARKYGKWITERYKNQPNIIWIMGGDRMPATQSQKEVVKAMGEGIYSVDQGKHLMTYHAWGGDPGTIFHNEKWKNFNMTQTGHSRKDNPVYEIIGNNYNLKPTKPCLNGEPQYEDIPVGFTAQNERFGAFDVRQAAYWSVLAGALGHTYGNNNIWQMWAPGREPVINARIPWYDAIHQPGAMQMGYMRKLFESRPFLKMIPDQDVMADVFGQNKNEIRAARGKDGSFVIVYTPLGNPVHIQMKKLVADSVNGYWYNPREGNSIAIESFKNNQKVKAFIPPSSGSRTDWVLVLDDEQKNYPDPGSITLK